MRFSGLIKKLAAVSNRIIMTIDNNKSCSNMVLDKLLIPSSAYPLAERDETKIDDYCGKKISNPYHWLEDPDSEKTKKYVDELNLVSSAYINQCPVKDQIHKTLKKFLDYPKYTCPRKEGNYYYFSHNTGLQNQSVLYKQDKLDGKPTIFLDPNLLSHDGTTSISMKSFTQDGSIMAYGLSEKGSDWVTVKFKKALDGSDLPDKLERLRYSSLCWTHDNKGVFYNRFPDNISDAQGRNATKNEFHRLYFHYLGTEQSKDILCVEFPNNPNYMIGAEVSEDGQFLIVTVDKGCDPTNLVYYLDLSAIKNNIKGKLDLVPIIDRFESKFSFISNDGFLFTFLTDYKAPMFQLVQIDVRKPEKENWKFLVKEEKNKLDWAARVNGDNLILCYLEDVKSIMHVHDFKSGRKLFTIPLDIGSITQFSGKQTQSEIFYSFQSFLTPGIIYHLDFSTSASPTPKVFKEITIDGLKPTDFIVKQVFYESRDKTKVPMFLFHKKTLTIDGTAPTLMYGYGGFNVSMLPCFSGLRTFFARFLNGIVAIPNIRGGDEYGKEWHEGGMKEKKQNVFDDFIAAGEYLIKNKYTCRDKLAIEGHSNGGLLVAACANQRPDLFGCVLNHVGVMDMLRYHHFTIGQAWVPEFGCADVPEEFETLIKYSPLHNIKAPQNDVHYPAMLLTTADHDDRVVPSHSLKFMAQMYYTLRHIDVPRKPVLIRVEVRAGHGSGKPISKIIEEGADVYAFLYNVLDLSWCA